MCRYAEPVEPVHAAVWNFNVEFIILVLGQSLEK